MASADWTAKANRLREKAERTNCPECRIDLLAEAADADQIAQNEDR